MMKRLLTLVFLFLLLPTGRAQHLELNVTLLEKEVLQGDNLDVAISVRNLGENVTNLTLIYWVWDGGKWFSGEEEFTLSPGATRYLDKKIFVYPNQPTGIYKVTFNLSSGTYQIDRTYTFSVVGREFPEELFESEEVDVTLESNTVETYVGGREKLILMISNNVGSTLNVRVTVKGIPTSWFELSEEKAMLEAYRNAYISLTLNIPAKASPGDYTAVVSVSTQSSIEEKELNLKVYESEYELFSSKLDFLREKLGELKKEINSKNLDKERVGMMLQNVELALKFAELHLENEDYGKVKESVIEILRMMDGIKNEIKLIGLESSRKVFPTLSVFVVIIILFSCLTALLIISYKKVVLEKFFKLPFLEARELAKSIKTVEVKESREELMERKRRITNLLRILEKQRKEGIISERAYREMKKRNEEKLREIEKRLMELQR